MTPIAVFSNNGQTYTLYPKNIINPYCVYLPLTKNNKIYKYEHINETIITKFLYNIFISNMYLGDNNVINKVNGFIKWINSFEKINKSNWFVVINKMYKNNLLN